MPVVISGKCGRLRVTPGVTRGGSRAPLSRVLDAHGEPASPGWAEGLDPKALADRSKALAKTCAQLHAHLSTNLQADEKAATRTDKSRKG